LAFGELLLVAIWVYTTTSCSTSADNGTEVVVTSDTVGILPSADPIQRIGKSDFRLTVRGGNERSFRFSRDGKLLAGSNWAEVRIWSFPDGKLKHDLSEYVQTNCIAFTDDGKEFLALNQREMEIFRFDVDTGRLLGKTKLADVDKEKGQTRYRLSDDGRWFCTTNLWGFVTVWDASTGNRQWRQKRFESHYAPISRAGAVTLWDDIFLECDDVVSGKQLSASKHYRTLLGFACNSEGTLLAAYSTADKAIVFLDPLADKRVGGMIPSEEREWRPNQAAISADGRRFVYWLNTSKWIFERKMAVFDIQTGNVVSSFEPHGFYSIDDPIISPDGKIVFTSGARSVFCPIDAGTGKPLHEVPDHIMAIGSLSFTPDGRTLLVGGGDKRQAWDVETGSPRTILESWYHHPYVAAVDNRRAIVSGLRNGGARLQDIETGAVERDFDKDSNRHFSGFQLAADRKSFVAIMYDPKKRFVRRYGISTGETLDERELPIDEERRMFDPKAYRGLALGGSRLYRFEQESGPKPAAGAENAGRIDLVLEDWTTQEVTNRFTIPAFSQFAMAETHNDRRLAIVASDDWYGPQRPNGFTYLYVFDVTTGQKLLHLKRDRGEYYAAFSVVALSPDARLVATASHQSRIDLWNTKTGQLLQRLESKNPIAILQFTDDGKKLASGHQDGRVYIWDTESAIALAAE
jgi:WD40 repeat protein